MGPFKISIVFDGRLDVNDRALIGRGSILISFCEVGVINQDLGKWTVGLNCFS